MKALRLGLLACLFVASVSLPAKPISFVFSVPANAQNPFAREIWADVVTPSGTILRLPAFHAGAHLFSVRVRPDQVGTFRIGDVLETLPGSSGVRVLGVDHRTPQQVNNKTVLARRAVQIDPRDRTRFSLADGQRYFPIGANLPWPLKEPTTVHYRNVLKEFSDLGLNWTRIWMVHWGSLNLDWLPKEMGASPAPGVLDQRVADHWDAVLASAEETGVYVQVVLQHHGQFSTQVNPNWSEHPWNAANPGGFLASPVDFFTSPEARMLTKWKYRYIVARWGWSPAVLAWELFNEVHWVDALRLARNEAAVAIWHHEMAEFLRSVDVYDHLVTTSLEHLHSPLYWRMDFFQPHLYASNMLAATRRFDPHPQPLDRPMFYGEVGDNHIIMSPEIEKRGVALVPPIWSSLMGPAGYPAQLWYADRLAENDRMGELGAVARFVWETGFAARDGLQTFSPAMRSRVEVPHVLIGGQHWQKRPVPELTVPLDGREPVEVADIPRVYVGAPRSIADGYPARAVFHVDYPRDAVVCIQIKDASAAGARVRVTLDEAVVALHVWPAPPPGPDGKPVAKPPPQPPRPVELTFPVTAGKRTLVLENDGGPDWFDLAGIDLGLKQPALAAVGKRDANFVALWLWRRDGVFALEDVTPADGTVLIDDLAPGRWTVTWWDSLKGVPGKPAEIDHGGGTLELPTPAFARHAAVVLKR